ncbi:CubicO group peptidase (beta-lactamase class C family) [Siphonobacter sp. BAB-5404]|nr:CubicO group peptidase (beta-lactamase class C family) [Siphonobacter sp. SORGH_AS_0500]
MNIASVSKTFLGFCIMKAVEQGVVSLDEDINTYLPFTVSNPNFPNEKITLRHLATHTSGLIDRYPFYMDSTYFYGGKKPEPLGDFLKNYYVSGGKYYSKANFLPARPGTKRDYSNIATGLAGYIIEIRTGQKLPEYSRRYIFKPLKMKHSGWGLNEIDLRRHAKLYEKKEDRMVPISLYECTTYPDGGVRTSVHDLAKFFITLLDNGKYEDKRLLNEELAVEMLRYQYTPDHKPDNVAIDKLNSGIFWSTKLGATRIGHNGFDPGVRTFMLSDLAKEVGIIVFFNASLSDQEENLFFAIYEELYKYGQSLKANSYTLDKKQ